MWHKSRYMQGYSKPGKLNIPLNKTNPNTNKKENQHINLSPFFLLKYIFAIKKTHIFIIRGDLR